MMSTAKMWVTTDAMAAHLSVSTKTLLRMKASGALVKGRHWTRKNISAPRSPLVWHIQRVEMALGRV